MNPTILEIKQYLLQYFKKNTCINPRKDQASFEFECNPPELKEFIIAAALKELEAGGIVLKVSTAKESFWVLNRPLIAFQQSVQLNFETILGLAEIVNGYMASSNEEDLCDPTNIREIDIRRLIIIANTISDELNKQSQKEEGVKNLSENN